MKLFLKSAAFAATFALAFTVASSHAEVVRPAPNFTWESFNGTSRSLGNLTKQPVVLIIAPSPKSGIFKKQLKRLQPLYRQFAGRDTVFVAVFTKETGVVESDIPFLYARDPQSVAADYGLADAKFELIVIGPDRNLDLITSDLTSGERVRDVIDNSFTRQAVRRK